MKILAIETSCDDTGVAVYEIDKGLLGHLVYTQSAHSQYQGIVPEIAARDHMRILPSLVEELLMSLNMGFGDIGLIAYTYAPGLIGSLLIGMSFAKSLAYSLGIKSMPIHHLEGHIYSPFIRQPAIEKFIALIASGGHTNLVLVQGFGNYRTLGITYDDAIGEAFDKVAKLMDLGFPGGRALSELASTYTGPFVELPTPLANPRKNQNHKFNFSFSGLKTCMAKKIRDHKKSDYPMLAASFEDKVTDILLDKLYNACREFDINTALIVGGVSANKVLRHKLKAVNLNIHVAEPEFCTDNAAMIAYAAASRFKKFGVNDDLELQAHARLDLK